MINLNWKLLCSLAIALWSTGCDQPAGSPTKSAPPAQDLTSQTVLPGEAPAGVAGVPADSPIAPVGSPSAALPPAAPSPDNARAAAAPAEPTAPASRIQLSAAIALAQTLPEGTSVLCSMDYQWVLGSARQGVEYLWVIELGNGQRLTGPANVSRHRGTIQAILRGVKPDQGPFKGAIFTNTRGTGPGPEQVSDFIELKN